MYTVISGSFWANKTTKFFLELCQGNDFIESFKLFHMFMQNGKKILS